MHELGALLALLAEYQKSHAIDWLAVGGPPAVIVNDAVAFSDWFRAFLNSFFNWLINHISLWLSSFDDDLVLMMWSGNRFVDKIQNPPFVKSLTFLYSVPKCHVLIKAPTYDSYLYTLHPINLCLGKKIVNSLCYKENISPYRLKGHLIVERKAFPMYV